MPLKNRYWQINFSRSQKPAVYFQATDLRHSLLVGFLIWRLERRANPEQQ
jgi:hypothetical protein